MCPINNERPVWEASRPLHAMHNKLTDHCNVCITCPTWLSCFDLPVPPAFCKTLTIKETWNQQDILKHLFTIWYRSLIWDEAYMTHICNTQSWHDNFFRRNSMIFGNQDSTPGCPPKVCCAHLASALNTTPPQSRSCLVWCTYQKTRRIPKSCAHIARSNFDKFNHYQPSTLDDECLWKCCRNADETDVKCQQAHQFKAGHVYIWYFHLHCSSAHFVWTGPCKNTKRMRLYCKSIQTCGTTAQRSFPNQ